jgi:NAD(P)-dependent dehydrogenase (short-subunit alcohol dehydrogenase family)
MRRQGGLATVPNAQAVVVGATGEVGAAIVLRLREAGVPVVAVARDHGRLEQLRATDGGITPCIADIGDDSSGEAIAAAVSAPVRMVVQTAAVPPAGPLATIDPDALGRSVSLKLGGLLRLIRAVEDRFVEGSRIVAIGGLFGSEPTPQTCGAGVTNAALANLIRQLSDAYGPKGVTVHMIAPGALETERLHRFAAAEALDRGVSVGAVLDEYRSESSLGRLTTPDQIGWAVTQLLAPEADALHGATITLDGGARRGLF